jgi:eukaryotic translation initiation factor 2C
MITVEARVLDPPALQYLRESTRPDNGSWNMIRKKFSIGALVKNWSFLKLNFGRDPLSQNFNEIIRQFHQMLNTCGLRADPPSSGLSLDLQEDDGQNMKNLDVQFQRARQQRLRLLLVILPTQRRETYAQIKTLADTRYGIHTVCVVADKIAKGQAQYMANVALKVNLKMGGANQTLAPASLGIIRDGKTMVVGIDVTHPSPGSAAGAPSIAGVVASTDIAYAQWPASLRIQKGRKEMVTDLTDMFVERLRLWQKRNNSLPTRILVYRDGVSEGQFSIVLRDELPLIRKACNTVYPPKVSKPKLAIVIVGKRHHTRFYPVADEDHDGRTGNPKNGTVVDRGVTLERGWDMFLQAHTGLQGTTRPAHYVVLLDEIGLGADGLEQLVEPHPSSLIPHTDPHTNNPPPDTDS